MLKIKLIFYKLQCPMFSFLITFILLGELQTSEIFKHSEQIAGGKILGFQNMLQKLMCKGYKISIFSKTVIINTKIVNILTIK